MSNKFGTMQQRDMSNQVPEVQNETNIELFFENYAETAKSEVESLLQSFHAKKGSFALGAI